MFVEMLLDNFFFNGLMKILDSVPILHFDLPVEAINTFMQILDGVAYFLPMDAVVAMLGILFVEELVKITLSFVKLIWKFIPIIGN